MKRGCGRSFISGVGHEADVRIEYVDAIEKTAAGKLRFVVSEVEGGRIVAAGV